MATGQLQLRLHILSSLKKRVVKNAALSSWYFHSGNFHINFVENFIYEKKKQPFLGRNPFLRQFSKVLLKFCYVTTSKDLAILDGKKTAIITVYFEDLIIFRVQP